MAKDNCIKTRQSEIPIVSINDDGLRPAGEPDQCFYCKSKIGEKHAYECVTITRPVRVRVFFDLVVKEPISFDADQIEFRINMSSSCMDNWLKQINEEAERAGCSCGFGHGMYVGEAFEDVGQ